MRDELEKFKKELEKEQEEVDREKQLLEEKIIRLETRYKVINGSRSEALREKYGKSIYEQIKEARKEEEKVEREIYVRTIEIQNLLMVINNYLNSI